MADRLRQGSSGVDAGTRAARSNSRGTVTNRSLHVQKVGNLCTCPLVDASSLTEMQIFWGRMYLGRGVAQHLTSQLTLGRDPHGAPAPLAFLLTSRVSDILFISHCKQSATVAVSKAALTLCCRVHTLFTELPRAVYRRFNPKYEISNILYISILELLHLM